jgi:hypothetical protein
MTTLAHRGYVTYLKTAIAALAIALAATSAEAADFYFAADGNDANDCLSPSTACHTIGKANSMTFAPGSFVLFRGGDNFLGNLTPQITGGGDPNNPVTFGSYSCCMRATITASAPTQPQSNPGGAVILISGVSGVTITDLILRGGDLAHMPRAGVEISNLGPTLISGIVIRNSDIAEIAYFDATKPPGPSGQGAHGGHIFIPGSPGSAGISNILIENNDLHGLNGPTSHDDVAISGWGGQPITNVTVRNNRVFDIGGGPTGLDPGIAYPPMGDGIEANGWRNALIERNVVHDVGGNMINCGGPAGILTANVIGATIQYNEVYRIQPAYTYYQGCDWIGIDADNGSASVVIQYNYTHDNFASGYLLFDGDTNQEWNNNTVRYNISQNDSTGGLSGFGAISISTPRSPNVYVYNNTTFNNQIYTGRLYGTWGQAGYGLGIGGTGSFSGLIANNAFMVSASITGGCSGVNARQNAGWTPPTATIENNHFQCLNSTYWEHFWDATMYNDFPSLQAASGKFQATTEGNPLIPAGGIGPNGYVLQRGSPMIGSGVNYSTLVPNPPTVDYFGNAIPTTAGYNRGADGAAHP